MKSIYYWSPCLNRVGTLTSTINSAIAMSKYSKKTYKITLINSCGEWDNYYSKLNSSNIEVIDLGFKYFKYLPKEGYFKSRLSYFIIFLFSFMPLLKLLKKSKPDYLIMHLLTSLPMILLLIFKFNTKFILRISGFPKLGFIRKLFWKLLSKKIFLVTSPTFDLIDQLKSKKIFKENKFVYLSDAIINISEFIKQKNNKDFKKDIAQLGKYFIAVGRLTRQKNFKYLINEFIKFLKLNLDYKLVIFGDGEEKKSLEHIIRKNKVENKIILKGFSENIFSYMKYSDAFILSSLWEDPGFVLIEAAISNTFIISSDCKNGPREFLLNGNAGILFKSNIPGALTSGLKHFLDKKNIYNKKILLKKC